MRELYYRLEGRNPVPCSIKRMCETMDDKSRRVGLTNILGVRVSTVFLGINHAWLGGPPVLFETMIFGGVLDQYQERCSTYDEAERMHRRAVWQVLKWAWVPKFIQEAVWRKS